MRTQALRLLLFIALLTAVCTTACTPEVDDRDHAIIIEDNVVERDLFTAGREVRLDSTFRGDLVTAGARVVLDGPIGGYAIVAARELLVRDDIANDLIAAGQTIDIAADIGDRAVLAGEAVHLKPGTVVGSALIGGDTVDLRGSITNDLKIGARETRLAGSVGGNVQVSARHVQVLPGASIGGDLVVRAPQPPEISPGAKIVGKVDYRPAERASGWEWRLGLWLWSFLALLALGLLANAFSPVWPQRVAATIATRPAASVLVGFGSLVVVPAVVVLLIVTLIGIPVAVILLALFTALLVLSTVFVAYSFGGWILARTGRVQPSPFSRVLVGALLLSFVMALPWVGWIAQIAVVLVGLGAVILERRDFRHQLRSVGLA